MTAALQGIAHDLREKRLWLLAAALLLALVAVPLLLSSGGGGPTPSVPLSATGAGAPAAPVLPTVQVSGGGVSGNASGSARNPFTAPSSGAAVGSSAPASAAQTSGPTPVVQPASAATGGTPASAAVGSVPSSSVTPSTPGAPKLPSAKPKPAPAGLSANESYSVSFAITNASGGFDTTDPLERLSPIPGAADPLLVEMGVLQGGRRVLFAVQPGALLNGPGQCIPGRVSCQLITLAPGQVESLSRQTPAGAQRVAWFAVTGIGVARHRSPAAASTVRRAASPAGRRLLSSSQPAALSLFSYDPAQGVVLDLRNLTVGGS
jgi:hypothetical protein